MRLGVCRSFCFPQIPKEESMSERRIIATFVPQALVTHCSSKFDKRVTFDVTDQILAMTKEQRDKLRDNEYNSAAELVPDAILSAHLGLFRVEVVRAIDDYFEEFVTPKTSEI
jgi:hypothetical protein